MYNRIRRRESEIMIHDKIDALMTAYRSGKLGGETMPEDRNPQLDRYTKENYMYFTLPMALNYQRNSYTLWECADRMFRNVPSVFDSKAVCSMDEDTLRSILVEHKVALQPNKHPIIWRTLCETIEQDLEGDIRNLFSRNDFSVAKIKGHITDNKKKFPYLAGNKICNYWLSVMERYTDAKFSDRENITVAPDTHVIQASIRLGIITESEAKTSGVQHIVADRWATLLADTDLKPIDVHTPLWLWSRGKFSVQI